MYKLSRGLATRPPSFEGYLSVLKIFFPLEAQSVLAKQIEILASNNIKKYVLFRDSLGNISFKKRRFTMASSFSIDNIEIFKNNISSLIENLIIAYRSVNLDKVDVEKRDLVIQCRDNISKSVLELEKFLEEHLSLISDKKIKEVVVKNLARLLKVVQDNDPEKVLDSDYQSLFYEIRSINPKNDFIAKVGLLLQEAYVIRR